MPVKMVDEAVIVLEGDCLLEDAEALLTRLLAHPRASVDWRGCHRAHTAVVQLLMGLGDRLIGPPQGDFLARHVELAIHGVQA